ncbi:phosphohistidine phosphatase SixA [Halomonas qinghailakensis]|uniref:Phosphohistidine phosphatase SixA n=2 Tax=Halomonas TaxID=2745 RepID=A0AA46YQ38_9GAMM|nr:MULTISPECIES: phosphohistidine phosphatase SixA [Halomonas]UYO74090.1 phosphohistidine phosphatase SixA [Halomonas sp. ZZQ-149]UYV17891.1 phosphohistidine phosphatase SixA [Halomonas qaidamensis]
MGSGKSDVKNVLIMRHGEAGQGFPDHARPLTPRGVKEVSVMAQWLARRIEQGELPCPTLYASPFVRAQQTAQLIADALGCSLQTLSFLTPDDRLSTVGNWLLNLPDDGPIMLVSHMPLVGELTGRLVEGALSQGMSFPTAAIAELEAEVLATGCATLKRFTQPSQLS